MDAWLTSTPLKLTGGLSTIRRKPYALSVSTEVNRASLAKYIATPSAPDLLTPVRESHERNCRLLRRGSPLKSTSRCRF
ncbi:hypothetical protein HYQ46_012312 [Verticillium longisporum]|nr:hypothetical protein HYQ44_000604 [Verticillium longisporum]KAG7151878.1 hypothetical protein HYQ46_012312 [Verticillium longisporum]